MARAFVAVVPPASVLDAVATHVDELRATARADIRWTRRSTWHLTLCFLGDDVDLDDARERCSRIEFETPPVVRLGGVGAFPRPARARVVWIGVAAGCEWFETTGTALHRAFGVPLRSGEPHPHLTIGRLRTPADVAASCHDTLAVGDVWTPAEVVLFETVRVPGGVEHVARATRQLP